MSQATLPIDPPKANKEPIQQYLTQRRNLEPGDPLFVKLRHAAMTAVLDATKGDVHTSQRFVRHRDVRTLQRYDDNREDLQGSATELLSNLVI